MKAKRFFRLNAGMLLPLLVLSSSGYAAHDPTVRTERIRLATSAAAYPYNYGPADGCSQAFCGFEVEIFNEICKEMNGEKMPEISAGKPVTKTLDLTCSWVQKDWGKGNFDDPNGILGGLFVAGADGSYQYDVVVNNVSVSAERRIKGLFTAVYYGAAHLFIGAKNLSVQFDSNGFPFPNQSLKIGTYPGYLLAELTENYKNGQGQIELKALADPATALAKGEIDLFFAWTGIPQQLQHRYPALGFEVKSSLVKEWQADPFGGVGAVVRPDSSGLVYREILSRGLVKIREKNIYQQISQKYFGKDVWNTQSGPRLQRDEPTRP